MRNAECGISGRTQACSDYMMLTHSPHPSCSFHSQSTLSVPGEGYDGLTALVGVDDLGDQGKRKLAM